MDLRDTSIIVILMKINCFSDKYLPFTNELRLRAISSPGPWNCYRKGFSSPFQKNISWKKIRCFFFLIFYLFIFFIKTIFLNIQLLLGFWFYKNKVTTILQKYKHTYIRKRNSDVQPKNVHYRWILWLTQIYYSS